MYISPVFSCRVTYMEMWMYPRMSLHMHSMHTVLLKDVANEQLSLLVLHSNLHTNRESKRTELKSLYSYSTYNWYLSLVQEENPFADKSVYVLASCGATFFADVRFRLHYTEI